MIDYPGFWEYLNKPTGKSKIFGRTRRVKINYKTTCSEKWFFFTNKTKSARIILRRAIFVSIKRPPSTLFNYVYKYVVRSPRLRIVDVVSGGGGGGGGSGGGWIGGRSDQTAPTFAPTPGGAVNALPPVRTRPLKSRSQFFAEYTAFRAVVVRSYN